MPCHPVTCWLMFIVKKTPRPPDDWRDRGYSLDPCRVVWIWSNGSPETLVQSQTWRQNVAKKVRRIRPADFSPRSNFKIPVSCPLISLVVKHVPFFFLENSIIKSRDPLPAPYFLLYGPREAAALQTLPGSRISPLYPLAWPLRSAPHRATTLPPTHCYATPWPTGETTGRRS